MISRSTKPNRISMKTHWKVESQSQLKYRKISDRTLLRSSAAVGRVCSPHNTILGPPGHSGHKTAVGQFLATRLSHIWSPAGHEHHLFTKFKLKNRAVVSRLAGVAALYQPNATKFARCKKVSCCVTRDHEYSV